MAEVNLSAFFPTRPHRSRCLEDKHYWNITLLKVRCTFSPFPLLQELTCIAKAGVQLSWHFPGSLLYSVSVLILHRYKQRLLMLAVISTSCAEKPLGLQVKCLGSAKMNVFWSWLEEKQMNKVWIEHLRLQRSAYWGCAINRGKKSTGSLSKTTHLLYIFTESRLKLSASISQDTLSQIVITLWKKI